MHMQMNQRLALSFGCCAVLTLVGLAPTPVVVKDRFTDNSINLNLWQPIQVGAVGVDEDNRRLEFYAMDPTGSFSYGGLGVASWGANWKQDFQVSMDYRLNLPNSAVAGDRAVWVGVDMSVDGVIPVTTIGYAAGVSRDIDGLHLDIMRFDGGGPVQRKTTPITNIAGTLEIAWDRSNDRLTARVGTKAVALTGVWSRFGDSMGFHPMLLAVGCTTIDGDVTFLGTRVYADNFEFTGVKKAGCGGCH